jgi:glycosyltransferase involved in cell wall biosynthesis
VSPHEPSLFQPAIEAAGLAECVIVQRPAGIDELRAFFHVADVGVCPRTLWTGAPVKILNYLAAGLPVVACRAGARHVLPPAAGCLVEDSPDAFAEAVLAELARDDQPRRSRTCRRAFERFRIAQHIPLYEQVYARVLKRRRPPEP